MQRNIERYNKYSNKLISDTVTGIRLGGNRLVWYWLPYHRLGCSCVYIFTKISHRFKALVVSDQARSQPARWGGGGLNLDGWNTRRTPPPLDIVRVTSSIWKTPPLLDIHKPPPLDIARVTSSTYSKGRTKLLKGGTKLLKGGTKLLKGGTKLLKGGTKLLKGGTKLLKGGTKLLKGGTKLLKGGTKSLGWATGGGVVRPPRPPLATGLVTVLLTTCRGLSKRPPPPSGQTLYWRSNNLLHVLKLTD